MQINYQEDTSILADTWQETLETQAACLPITLSPSSTVHPVLNGRQCTSMILASRIQSVEPAADVHDYNTTLSLSTLLVRKSCRMKPKETTTTFFLILHCSGVSGRPATLINLYILNINKFFRSSLFLVLKSSKYSLKTFSSELEKCSCPLSADGHQEGQVGMALRKQNGGDGKQGM